MSKDLPGNIPDPDLGLVGNSQPIYDLRKRIREIGPFDDQPVLLLGETGTGKELVAQALHAISPRKAKRIIARNCAEFDAYLASSQLFGSVPGAFTGAVNAPGAFEQANGSTLFLDEIGDLDLKIQARLLRILEEMQVWRVGAKESITIDVRVVAATNLNVTDPAFFRQELRQRFGVPIRIPALRHRLEDVPLLAQHFLEIFCIKHRNEAPLAFGPGVLETLQAHTWSSGNVRELKNAVNAAARRATQERKEAIGTEYISLEIATAAEFFPEETDDPVGARVRRALQDGVHPLRGLLHGDSEIPEGSLVAWLVDKIAGVAAEYVAQQGSPDPGLIRQVKKTVAGDFSQAGLKRLRQEVNRQLPK